MIAFMSGDKGVLEGKIVFTQSLRDIFLHDHRVEITVVMY